MDPAKELEEEHKRRIQLEEQLAFWQEKGKEGLPPEQIALAINKQQLDSVTFQLVKCRRQIAELNSELKDRDRRLKEFSEQVESLEDDIDLLRKENRELKSQPSSPQEGQKTGSMDIPSDEDLNNLLDSAVEKKVKEPKRTIRDFVQVLRRIERIKPLDASLLLNVRQDEVMKWAEELKKRGYLTVDGLDKKTLVATDKLLKTR